MTLSEVANILKFPEEHIRLYIKQDLIPEIKRNTKEPNISEKDLTYIKRVIVLRRLRWRFIDIASYTHGKDTLFGIAEHIAYLMEKDYKDKVRPDFLILTKQIANEKNPQLDADRYIDLINNSDELKDNIVEPELNLKSFILADFPRGYIQNMLPNRSIKNTILFGLVVCLIISILEFIQSKALSNSIDVFFQTCISFIGIVIFIALIYFFRRFFGARILQGFLAVVWTILCLLLAIAAVVPLIALLNLF